MGVDVQVLIPKQVPEREVRGWNFFYQKRANWSQPSLAKKNVLKHSRITTNGQENP
jgi:hypothetical protein